MSELKGQIIKFIEELNPYEDIDENTRLVEAGIIDSLVLFGLVTACEDFYDIEIPEEMINKENFTTVEQIARMLSALLEKGAEK